MASAAEQLAANLSLSAFSKATELKQRLWYTLGALVVFRFLTFVPVPGIDPIRFAEVFQKQAQGILGMLNLFSGGGLERMSIVALNIMPYITASIIVQLLTSLSPTLGALRKEGESGRRKINEYTRYGAVLLAIAQGYGIAITMERSGLAIEPGFVFRLTAVITLVGGTMFLMWLGEQITSRGVGNGSSLIIFAGIVAAMPKAIGSVFELSRSGELSIALVLAILALLVVVIVGIVFMERAQRKVPIQYPKRQVGNKMFQGDTSHMPLKLNTAGVIPPIFASSLLLLPLSVANFSSGEGPEWLGWITRTFQHGAPLYMISYALLIAFFCFFYTAVVFNPEETSENLKKQGGFVPGIRPGQKTADYLDYVLTRITVVGAAYLVVICLLPEFLIAEAKVPFYLGGTSLLIVVSVTMDTIQQIQGHLLAHQYDAVLKKAKFRGKGK
jgi:preprotein translocase subunit SecY